MVRRCAITNCPNNKHPTETIHSFPTYNPYQYRRWMEYVRITSNLNVDEVNLDNFGICSNHFPYDAYKDRCSTKEWGLNQVNRKRRLKEYAVPMLLESDEILATYHSERSVLLNDHSYCSLSTTQPYKYGLLQLENDSLKWILNNKISIIEKKNQEIDNLKRMMSRLTQKNENPKHPPCIACSEFEAKGEDVVLVKNVKTLFTPSQISLLSNDNVKKVRWNDEDKSRAIAQFSASSRGYEYAREKLKLPLPTQRSIYRWLQKVSIYPDEMLIPSMKLIEDTLQKATPMMRMCALAIDEMSIDSRYCYNANEDKIYGGAKNATVVTVRGLFMDWKQVVYYTFDSVTSGGIRDIIRKLHAVNADVVSLTSDMGSKNQALWKELGVGRVIDGVVQSTSFIHPVNGNNVWIFPDLPHLIKLLRNHTIDNAITLEDGTVIDKELFRDLICKQQKGEFKLAYQLTHKNIEVRGQQRQAVAPAFRLFSHKVAEALKFMYPENEVKHKQAAFIQLVNDFCDLSNTRVKTKKQNPFKSPYGTYLAEQNELYETAFQTFSKMKVGQRRRKTYAPFQKGLLMYIMSIRGLLQDVKMPPVSGEYIMTAHVNQDLLENAFSRIRGFGSFHQNPNAVEVGTRIKKLILSWNFVDSKRTAVEFESFDIGQRDCATFHQARAEAPPPEDFNEMEFERIMMVDCNIEDKELLRENFGTESIIEEGGREYVAGFIAEKLSEKHPELSKTGSGELREAFWVPRISNKLTEPSLYWHNAFNKFDEFFVAVHDYNSVCRKRGICKNLVNTLQLSFPEIHAEILKFYVGIRTNIRIRHMNKRLEDEAFRRAGFLSEHGSEEQESGTRFHGESEGNDEFAVFRNFTDEED